ncbi:MAG: signal recognition particle protein, partial [Chloroflexi bacterium]|nr:signal recognition particle protein [Chloroflexota bacterium]
QKQLPAGALDEDQMKRVVAIVLSMTPLERRHPEIIGGSRRKRISRGSGTTPAEVNQLLNQFEQMRKLMKQMSNQKGRVPKLPAGFRLG